MKVLALEQCSPEWFTARAGKLTGSGAKEATSAPSSAAYQRMKAKLVVERLTGKSAERAFSNRAVEQGKELEPVARAAYEAHAGLAVHEVGFVLSDDGESGCSPDGMVNNFEGEIQIKCPEPTAHLLHLTSGIPEHYVAQLLHHMWITGVQWIDFVSYNESFPEPHRLTISRLKRNDLALDAYERKAQAFLRDVRGAVDSLLNKR